MGSETRQYISNLPLFSQLPDEQISNIEKSASIAEYAQGQHIIDAGQYVNGFYIVLSGVIILSIVTPDGSSRVIDIISPGRSFAEAILFLKKPSPVLAEAREPSRVMYIPESCINYLIPESEGFSRHLIAGLSARLHKLIMDIETCTLHRSKLRVVSYLVSEAESLEAESNSPRISLPVSKKIIASNLGLTAETFSRILNDLSTNGLIGVDGINIDIPDLVSLQQYKQSLS